MLKSRFVDKSKNREVRMPGWPMDGIPVKRQAGMIYWYSWGPHTFDIRVMRRVLGLPNEHPADHWFMAKKPNPCKSFETVIIQIEEALGARTFHDAMAAHDRAQDEDALAQRAVEVPADAAESLPF